MQQVTFLTRVPLMRNCDLDFDIAYCVTFMSPSVTHSTVFVVVVVVVVVVVSVGGLIAFGHQESS